MGNETVVTKGLTPLCEVECINYLCRFVFIVLFLCFQCENLLILTSETSNTIIKTILAHSKRGRF